MRLFNMCLQHTRTKHASSTNEHAEAIVGYPTLSSDISAVALGSLLGGLSGYYRKNEDLGIDPAKGALVGACLGGAGSLLARPTGMLLAMIHGARSKEEQRNYNKSNKWKNWLIPGFAPYNRVRTELSEK